MFELKPIPKEALTKVLDKAEHYRFLNEALEAECICLDVLDVDPENQRALYILALALSDQTDRRPALKTKEAHDVAARLTDEFQRRYVSGIICERRAKADMRRASVGAEQNAHEWFLDAMEHFEAAAAIAPKGNYGAILRWNTCARILNRNPNSLVPPTSEPQQMLE